MKYFVNSKYFELLFVNRLGNKLEIRPNEKRAVASGGSGTAIRGLPSDYEVYHFHYNTAVLPDEDIEYIFQWTNALRLDFWTGTAIPLQLQQHPDKLGNLAHLETISSQLSTETYGELRAQIFIESIKSLKSIVFCNDYLTAKQFDEFMQNQTTPNGWTCKIDKWSYQCMKK